MNPGTASAQLGVRVLPITNGDSVGEDAEKSVGMLATYASLRYNGEDLGSHLAALCTATLISPTALLTAEHCVNEELLTEFFMDPSSGLPAGVEVSEFSFKFSWTRSIEAMNDGSDLGETFAVRHIDHSSDFLPLRDGDAAGAPAPQQWNDIAIVHLEDAIKDHPVQKLATPEMVKALKKGAAVLASGYGLTDDADEKSSGTLTSGRGHIAQIGAHEITTDPNDAQQACHGDSGGPLFIGSDDDYQIGITSRADHPDQNDPTSCATGTVYTRVDAYFDWIKQQVPDLGGASAKKDDGGCSLRAPGQTAGLLPLLSLLGIGLVMRRRRRA